MTRKEKKFILVGKCDDIYFYCFYGRDSQVVYNPREILRFASKKEAAAARDKYKKAGGVEKLRVAKITDEDEILVWEMKEK